MSETLLAYMGKSCPVCRTVFQPRRDQTCCSKRCANTARADARWANVKRLVLAPWKPNETRCKQCGHYYRPKRKDGMFCSKVCAHKHWNAKRKTRTVEGRHVSDAPIYAQRTMVCACGGVWACEIRDGVTWEYCTSCQRERPVKIRGVGNRKLDQRERLEAELKARQETAQAPVDPKYRDLGGGSAYRQKAYQKAG